MHQAKNYKAVLFDLDGTLMDTAEGVISSVRYTIDKMGYPTLPDEVLRTFIGPPVKRSLMETYHLEEEEAARATEVFRNRYKNHDLLRARPYEGILALIRDLKLKDYLTGVATLKREDYALMLLQHFDFPQHFDIICGSDFASKMQKSDVLESALGKLHCSSSEAVLIGDTASDGDGAARAGVDFLAVTYGFGFRTKEEWAPYRPVYTAQSVSDVRTFFKL